MRHPEAFRFLCATANAVQVAVVEDKRGRRILGIIDGASLKGVETEEGIACRREFLHTIDDTVKSLRL